MGNAGELTQFRNGDVGRGECGAGGVPRSSVAAAAGAQSGRPAAGPGRVGQHAGGRAAAGGAAGRAACRARRQPPTPRLLPSASGRAPAPLPPDFPHREAACPRSATCGGSGGLSCCRPFCSWSTGSWLCRLQQAPHIHSTVLRCAMYSSSCCSFGPGGQPAPGLLRWKWSEPPLAPPPWPPTDCIEPSPPSPP